MRPSERLLLVPLALAALFGALCLERVVAAGWSARVELGRTPNATVSSAVRARLAALEDPVTATWYRTPPADMPSHLRALEDALLSTLAALRDASNGRFDFAVADPREHPEWAEFLASAGIAPRRARRIERDGWRETEVWSSLAIACGPRPQAVLNGLGPDHLPELQRWILAQIDELVHPRRASVALAAPARFAAFRGALAQDAELAELDFEAGAELPRAAELFVWLAPRSCGARELAAIDRFLARGGSVLVAGSAFEAEPSEPGNAWRATGFPAPSFLAHYGLRALDGLLLDALAPDAGDAGASLTPFDVPCIAPRQDFRALQGQPNGTLVFRAPSAFEPEPARLAELGLEALVIGRARESALLSSVPERALSPSELAALDARPAADAGLAALLRPSDPWRGALVVLGSASPFEDELFDDERFAHRELARVLASSLLSAERRVASTIARARPEPLRELGAGERRLWRAFVVALPPLVVLLPLASRLRRRTRRAHGVGLALAPRFGLLALALAAVAWIPAGGALDLTRDGANRFTAAEIETLRAFARSTPGTGPIVLETWFSAPGHLPPELRPLARDARATCDELARRAPEFAHRAREVRELDDDGERELAALGIRAEVSTSSRDEVTTVRRVVGALRIARGERSEQVELSRPADFDALRFRVAFALQRLATGRAARIAFAAEPPRLSPAEAALEYQQKGLFAPSEGDVYSELAELLRRAGFRIERIDPARPQELDAELLVWVQPRRDATPLLARASELLERGGRVLVAAQHFRVLGRQLGRSRLDLAFWPEPQFPDLDRHYLPALGIQMPRELVFDRSSAPLDLPTRVERAGGGFELVPQPTVQPFLVRASERGYSADARALRGLGELLFPYPTRIAWDAGELARNGISAEPWISTSEGAWTFDWQGGDLPAEVLQDGSSGGARVLAALFRGRFPRAERVVRDPRGAAELALVARGAGGREGELLVIGCSEMWRNELLHDPRFRHDRLALAAAAQLALEPEIAAFLGRRAAPPGIGGVSARERNAWRALVLGAFPLALLVVALARRLRP